MSAAGYRRINALGGERLMTTWDAHPPDVLWYGEIIYDWPDAGDCDHSYGFASSEDEPDQSTLTELLPEGRVILEWKILPTPRNPLWTPSEEEES